MPAIQPTDKLYFSLHVGTPKGFGFTHIEFNHNCYEYNLFMLKGSGHYW